MTTTIDLGLEVVLAGPPPAWRGARLGLLCNQASVDRDLAHAADLLAARSTGRLAALFGPQHGLWCEEQDDMDETAHGTDERLDVPVHSLYAERRAPTAAMLAELDHLVCDLPDVGTRVYTYVWTLTLAMEACAAAGVPVWVLDRPNPLGGEVVEGPALEPGCASFVGRWAIPMRHALTTGELARLLNAEMEIGCELEVVPMRGWRRELLWSDLGRPWLPPSPNLPRFEGALLYPGTVLLEGTNLSEGRGTTTPFELVGAPWLDPRELADRLGARDLPGLVVRPYRFRPTFQKHAGESCGGVFLHATEPRALRPWRTGVEILRAARALCPAEFAWRSSTYEYVSDRPAIDVIAGTPALRAAVDEDAEGDALAADVEAWRERVAPHRLYGA